jgi:hypothetical protein
MWQKTGETRTGAGVVIDFVRFQSGIRRAGEGLP